MNSPRIAAVRASIVAGDGAVAGEPGDEHWQNGVVASPMAAYSGYETRESFGLDTYKTFIVEVESTSGEVGLGISHGGIPACWIVENQLARLVEGRPVSETEQLWDQLWRSTLHYGRKGLVVNAISAIDLALWDLAGKLRAEPVHELLGGAVHDELVFYATGPRPDIARTMGFAGGKMPLPHGLAAGAGGLRKNLELAGEMRSRVGEDFFLAFDCWMALDLDYALRLAEGLAPNHFSWLEECFPPDDYWSYVELRRRAPAGLEITTGEHEAGLRGFQLLVDMGCCDVVQPDLRWCGGLTEALRIADYADAHAVRVLPHVSSVYAYHFLFARPGSNLAEYLMSSADGATIEPYFGSLVSGEPLPRNGRMALSELDRPGFGISLDPDAALERPFPR